MLFIIFIELFITFIELNIKLCIKIFTIASDPSPLKEVGNRMSLTVREVTDIFQVWFDFKCDQRILFDSLFI
jgi:hypothetical protein